MFSPQIRRFLRLQRIAMSLAGLSFGLLLSVLSNWLSEQWVGLLPWVIAVALVSGVIGLVFFFRKPLPGIDVAIQIPQTIRSPEEAKQYARRGFVGFVPLYTPKRGTAADSLSVEQRKEAVEALDFDRLQVRDSNLQPTIEAIVSHASQLEQCWLLATRGDDVPGSLPYAPLLAEYLRQRERVNCQFHYGEAYTISLDDDALVLSKTYDQVRRVFREATEKRISRRDIVADITTGVRSMTLGMVLACLDRDQDIEFVGTRYNEKGTPKGDLFPIIFSFEPFLE
jgi:hypothetical protein